MARTCQTPSMRGGQKKFPEMDAADPATEGGAADGAAEKAPWAKGGTLLRQGAEAKVYSLEYLGRAAIMKERFAKTYRHPDLDRKLRYRRTLAEVRAIIKVRKGGIGAPALLEVDYSRGIIVMERIVGRTLRDVLFALSARKDEAGGARGSVGDSKMDGAENAMVVEGSAEGGGVTGEDDVEAMRLMTQLGQIISALHHSAGIVHGDLTTSNVIVRDTGELCPIDFGLSYTSRVIEDLAVDLYVLERAFLSTHPNSERLFQQVLRAYHGCQGVASKVLQKLESVRRRGRKREMIG